MCVNTGDVASQNLIVANCPVHILLSMVLKGQVGEFGERWQTLHMFIEHRATQKLLTLIYFVFALDTVLL